jgi:spore germination protein GerM
MRRLAPGLLLVLGVALSAAAIAGGAAPDAGTTTLKVHFGKEGLATGDAACRQVAPVIRTVPKTQGVARAALQELFRGPTPEERSEGYYSMFSDSTRSLLKAVRIVNGTAYVDLHDPTQLLPGATSSCGSMEFFSQVEATLTQFPTVDRVIFAIEGQPRLFYEWMEMDCDQSNDHCDDGHF